MAAGRKKTPTNLHVLNGTDRPCRRNKEEPQPDMPDDIEHPPEYLSKAAKDEWYRTARLLHKIGLLTEVDYTEFKNYCIAEGQIEDAVKEMGDSFTVVGKNGVEVVNPLMKIIHKSMELSHKFLTEYGMTPSSRTKVKASKSTKQSNKFANNSKTG